MLMFQNNKYLHIMSINAEWRAEFARLDYLSESTDGVMWCGAWSGKCDTDHQMWWDNWCLRQQSYGILPKKVFVKFWKYL